LSIESHLAVKTSIKLLLYADDTFDTNASGAYDTYANPEQCWANMHTDPSIFPSWLPWEIRRVLYLSLKMFELRFLNEKERSLRALFAKIISCAFEVVSAHSAKAAEARLGALELLESTGHGCRCSGSSGCVDHALLSAEGGSWRLKGGSCRSGPDFGQF
jgi:hypothetical protein